MSKPILCLDFDGVLHSYTSGWRGAKIIADKPVPGAVAFLEEATKVFEVHIFSSRSHQEGGIEAMRTWLSIVVAETLGWTQRSYTPLRHPDWVDLIKWPTEKPPAHVSLDDRAMMFTGEWPPLDDLLAFKPWNKLAQGDFVVVQYVVGTKPS